MRKNYTQTGVLGSDDRIHLADDWYSLGLPANIELAENVFIDTSYGFAGFNSRVARGFLMGEASGCYDRTSLIVSEGGVVQVGKFTILNGSTLICKKHIQIGDHCMLAWGSVLTDSWLPADRLSIEQRRRMMETAAHDSLRRYPFADDARPVVLEDNCWVGFDAVILPGVRLGRGCVIGCKTVVHADVPPYAVIAGCPAQIIRYLQPTDTEEVRQSALHSCIRNK